MKNPNRALEALTTSETPVGKVSIREITLGLAGILERIDSPLVTGKNPKFIMEWAPTLYAMTHTTPESERLLAQGRKAYDQAALVWSDTIPLVDARRILLAARDAGRRLAEVSDGDDDDEQDVDVNGVPVAPSGNAPAATDG